MHLGGNVLKLLALLKLGQLVDLLLDVGVGPTQNAHQDYDRVVQKLVLRHLYRFRSCTGKHERSMLASLLHVGVVHEGMLHFCLATCLVIVATAAIAQGLDIRCAPCH